MDGQSMWLGMIAYYEHKDNPSPIKSRCFREPAKKKLMQNYCTNKILSNIPKHLFGFGKCCGKLCHDEKIGTLNTALQDNHFTSVCTIAMILVVQTETPLDYRKLPTIQVFACK